MIILGSDTILHLSAEISIELATWDSQKSYTEKSYWISSSSIIFVLFT